MFDQANLTHAPSKGYAVNGSSTVECGIDEKTLDSILSLFDLPHGLREFFNRAHKGHNPHLRAYRIEDSGNGFLEVAEDLSEGRNRSEPYLIIYWGWQRSENKVNFHSCKTLQDAITLAFGNGEE